MNPSGEVSLIISNYNYGEYLYETISCILRQTVLPDELLIVDDCSSDHSRDLLVKLAAQDSRITLVLNEKNLGAAGAINLCFEKARNKYVCSLGADDPLHDPTFLEKALTQCRLHPEASFCFGEYISLYEAPSTAFANPVAVGLSPGPRYFNPNDFSALYSSRTSLSIPTAPSLWLKSEFKRVGYYKPSLDWLADWFAALVLGFRHGVCYVPGYFQTNRYNPRSASQSGMSDRDAYRNRLNILFETIEQPEFSDVAERFANPGVISRFGFKLLSLLSTDPRHERFLSLPLIRNAILHDGCAFNVDLEKFGKNPPKAVVVEVCRKILATYSQMLLNLAREFRSNGRYSQAVVQCRRALDAKSDNPEAIELCAILEKESERWSRPQDRR